MEPCFPKPLVAVEVRLATVLALLNWRLKLGCFTGLPRNSSVGNLVKPFDAPAPLDEPAPGTIPPKEASAEGMAD